MFRSTKHEVHTVKVNKVALNDKRIVKKDGIGMLARGHKSLCWNPLLRDSFVTQYNFAKFFAYKMPPQ